MPMIRRSGRNRIDIFIFEQFANSPDGFKAKRFEVERRVRRFCIAREGALSNAWAEMLERYRIPNTSDAPTSEEIEGARS